MNHKISSYALVVLLILGAIAGFVTAQITSSLNMNGQNRFTIQNYSEITGIGNLSVGSGTNYLDIYSGGTTIFFDTLGFGATFTDNVTTSKNFLGNISWTYLNSYPVACPAGSYLTQLDDSVTCTTISNITNNLQVNNLSITGTITVNGSAGFSGYGATACVVHNITRGIIIDATCT